MSRHALIKSQEFEALLTWLAPGRELAGEKYEAIRRMLLSFFERRHCVPADEYVDETIDRVARRLAGGERVRCVDHSRYFYGVARKLCLEIYRDRAHRRDLAWHLASCAGESPFRAVCLHHCERKLGAESMRLLEAYYVEDRTALAARLGLSPNALRLRVFKEKRKLRTCIARCLTRSDT